MQKPPDQADEQPAGESLSSWLTVVAQVGAALGVVAFFAFYITVDVKRGYICSLLLLPDQVVHSWVDGDWARFGILDRVPVLAATVAILVSAYLVGRLLLDLLGLDRHLSQLEIVGLGTGAGLNFLSLYTLTLGLVGALQSRTAFVAAAALVVCVCAYRWRGDVRRWIGAGEKSEDCVRTHGDRTWMSQLTGWLGVPFIIAIVAGGMLPPWHFDTREYHAQVPKEWYQQGEVTFMPHNVYGNMPLGAEMHAIVGTNLMTGADNWWWGALVGKTVIAAYAPLTALMLLAFGNRFVSRSAGAAAAFFFVSTPWVMHVSASGLIDVASAFYLFATFHVLMIWYEDCKAKGSSKALPFLTLAGVLAGAAVACKYPAVLFVVIPGALATTILPLGRIHFRQVVVFSLAVAIASGMWFGKNLVLAENPTYPLLYSVFGGKTRTPAKDQQWTVAHGPPRDMKGNSYTMSQAWTSTTLLLWRSEFGSIVMLPLAVFGLFARRHSRLLLVVSLLVGFNVVAWWLLTHRIDRFLVPILPLVSLFVGVGISTFHRTVWRYLIIGVLIVGFVFNLMFFVSPFPGDNRFLTAYADLRRDDVTEGPFSVERLHRTHKYLNQVVTPGYSVMCVGEAQVFDFEMPVIYNTCFDDCVFETMMKDRSSQERVQALRDRKVSHVLFMWYELDRYREPGNYGYSDYVTRELIRQEFVDTGILREIPLEVDPNNSQLFEVIGWQDWNNEHNTESPSP